jgi:hypothetical protein
VGDECVTVWNPGITVTLERKQRQCPKLTATQCGKKNLRNKVVAVLGLLQATEGHLGTGDVLLGVLEVLEESVVVPLNALLLVGIGVGVALDGTSLAAPEAVQGRADLVAAVLLNGVALSTSGLEEVGTLLDIAWTL